MSEKEDNAKHIAIINDTLANIEDEVEKLALFSKRETLRVRNTELDAKEQLEEKVIMSAVLGEAKKKGEIETIVGAVPASGGN